MRAARTAAGLSCERSDVGASGRALRHGEHDQEQPADADADRVRPSRGGERAVPAVTAAAVTAYQQAAMSEQFQLPGTEAELESAAPGPSRLPTPPLPLSPSASPSSRRRGVQRIR